MRYLKSLIFVFLALNCSKKFEEESIPAEPLIYGAVKFSEGFVGIFNSFNEWELKKIEGENVKDVEKPDYPGYPVQFGIYFNKPLGIFRKNNGKYICAYLQGKYWKEIKLDFPNVFRVGTSIPIILKNDEIYWTPGINAISTRLPFVYYSKKGEEKIFTFPHYLKVISVWTEKDEFYLSTKKIRKVEKLSSDRIAIVKGIKDPIEIWKVSENGIEKVAEISFRENPKSLPVLGFKNSFKIIDNFKLKKVKVNLLN